MRLEKDLSTDLKVATNSTKFTHHTGLWARASSGIHVLSNLSTGYSSLTAQSAGYRISRAVDHLVFLKAVCMTVIFDILLCATEINAKQTTNHKQQMKEKSCMHVWESFILFFYKFVTKCHIPFMMRFSCFRMHISSTSYLSSGIPLCIGKSLSVCVYLCACACMFHRLFFNLHESCCK